MTAMELRPAQFGKESPPNAFPAAIQLAKLTSSPLWQRLGTQMDQKSVTDRPTLA